MWSHNVSYAYVLFSKSLGLFFCFFNLTMVIIFVIYMNHQTTFENKGKHWRYYPNGQFYISLILQSTILVQLWLFLLSNKWFDMFKTCLTVYVGSKYGTFFGASCLEGDLCLCVCNFLWMQWWTSSSGKGWLFLPPPTQVTVPLRPVRPPLRFHICMENIFPACLYAWELMHLFAVVLVGFGIISWIWYPPEHPSLLTQPCVYNCPLAPYNI